MRPAGDVSVALINVLERQPEQGLTLREIAAEAQVGMDVAKRTIYNMRRYGRVRIAQMRRVSYRNRPVAVYALPDCGSLPGAGSSAPAFLQNCWSS